MKRQKPEVGDVFVVPLIDGSGVVGQIVGREASALNSWTCAFSHHKFSDFEKTLWTKPLTERDLVSLQLVTGDLLKSGKWRICGKKSVEIPQEELPYEHLRDKGWVGAKVIGSGIIESFLNAYFGLDYWDQMYDPDYFNNLLFPGVSKPKNVKYKKEKTQR